MTRSFLPQLLIGGVTLSLSGLSMIVAFGSFADKPQAISVITTSALIYGVAVGWLEGGYVLLRNDANRAAKAVFALVVMVRLLVFGLAAAFGLLVTSYGMPVLEFAAVAAGLSCGSAVIAGTRSGKLLAAAAVYLICAISAAAACLYLNIRGAMTVVLVYALATGGPVTLLAAARAGRGWPDLLRHMVQRTKSFIVDLPITAAVENGDRVLLSMFATPAMLVAYNGVKVALSLQREFNRFLKQVTFHRLYDDASRSTDGAFTRRFLCIAVSAQGFALMVVFTAYWLVHNGLPDPQLVEIALCVSTAYTLVATHAIAAARTLMRSSSAFLRANIISFCAVVLAMAALLPLSSATGALQAVYLVAAGYLAFYAIKTMLLFNQLKA